MPRTKPSVTLTRREARFRPLVQHGAADGSKAVRTAQLHEGASRRDLVDGGQRSSSSSTDTSTASASSERRREGGGIFLVDVASRLLASSSSPSCDVLPRVFRLSTDGFGYSARSRQFGLTLVESRHAVTKTIIMVKEYCRKRAGRSCHSSFKLNGGPFGPLDNNRTCAFLEKRGCAHGARVVPSL